MQASGLRVDSFACSRFVGNEGMDKKIETVYVFGDTTADTIRIPPPFPTSKHKKVLGSRSGLMKQDFLQFHGRVPA